ncbi:hypothetical protein [Moritella dasanensis]|uniref:hypothetical protein n=1 Tax=Moritella dasanensis TaxID=428031 RepID=UPI0002F5A234|nr:hypothetical protein [Moritella dasanensis]
MLKVKTGEVGLLLTKVTKRSPFDGYTDDKESDKKLFKSVLKDGDCFFNTGDLVYYQGFRHIAFVDRLGDTFRWKGENVATTQVEGQLNDFKHLNSINTLLLCCQIMRSLYLYVFVRSKK